MASEDRFGYEWDNYSWMTKDYERQFLNWTYPLTKESWKGKSFIDAGCGMGRNSYWPMRWGAASCIAFDNDERSLTRARETLKEFSTAKIERHNIHALPWQNEFDVAFSIGVIHHLEDPKVALANMVNSLKSGGTLLIWVYSYEGNEWIVRFVNPVRKNITSKLPLPLVHFLSYFCSTPLYLFVQGFRGPTPYLKQLSTFDFWHLHSIVFDQLIPTIAHYWKKDEVGGLVESLPVCDVKVEKTPEGTGWILTATKI